MVLGAGYLAGYTTNCPEKSRQRRISEKFWHRIQEYAYVGVPGRATFPVAIPARPQANRPLPEIGLVAILGCPALDPGRLADTERVLLPRTAESCLDHPADDRER